MLYSDLRYTAGERETEKLHVTVHIIHYAPSWCAVWVVVRVCHLPNVQI